MDIPQDAPTQLTVLGLLTIFTTAIGVLWRQLAVERKQAKKELADERRKRDEDRERCHKELVALNDRLISSQAELQSFLKDITNAFNFEQLLKEYLKKN